MKVAVIGAGFAGLISGRELQREGHEVVVFEKTDQIGGTWVYDPRVDSDPMGLDPNREVVHSSMYKSLRTNLPRQVMGFLDYPFTVGSGDPRHFPGHEEVLRFLKDFARDFGLVDRIRLGHEVVRVEPVTRKDGDKWAVEWRRRGGDSDSDVELFHAVVICNGKYSQPVTAQFPGMDVWPGMQMHSHNYRVPDPFQDKIVIIIGNRASGTDIIRDVSSVAKQVHQATRSHAFFDFQNTDNSTIKHPLIKCAHEDGKVDFEDGCSIYADAIIHCTGFKYHYPFLRTNGIVKVEDNRVGPLYKHVFPPNLAPRLSFVGIPQLTANAVMMELQSKWVAKVLSGQVPLPSEEEMIGSVADLYQKMEEAGLPNSSTHKLFSHCEYEKWIVAELGLPPLEKWRVTLLPTIMSDIIREHGAQYIDKWDVQKWIQETQSS